MFVMESRKLLQVDETLYENVDASESYFDFIIGQIEDILIDEQFQVCESVYLSSPHKI